MFCNYLILNEKSEFNLYLFIDNLKSFNRYYKLFNKKKYKKLLHKIKSYLKYNKINYIGNRILIVVEGIIINELNMKKM